MREEIRALHRMARALQTAYETQIGFAQHLRIMAGRREARALELGRQLSDIRNRLQEIGDIPT